MNEDEVQALYDKRVAQALDETIASIPATSPGVGLSEVVSDFVTDHHELRTIPEALEAQFSQAQNPAEYVNTYHEKDFFTGQSRKIVQRIRPKGKNEVLRRFAQRVVEQAKLDAQRVRQQQYNSSIAPVVRTPLSNTVLCAYLAAIYGYEYRRVHSVGLKLRGT